MKLDYTLTLADWKAALRLHSRQKLGRRIHFFIYDFVISAIAILALIGMIAAYAYGQSDLVDGLIIPVSALVVLAILLPILRNLMIRKSYKGMFPFSKTGPGYSLDIDDERILSTRPGIGEAKYYWTGICAFAQNEKITLLYLSEILFIGIPTNKLSPDQRTELNDLVSRHVVKRKP
jgi:hypothetical protein